MRSVRCDACGAKALMAASKCPKCSHEIEVRDGFGEMLPLAHCQTCDSFYPEKLGACRWCGTTPQRASVAPFVWKAVGIATFAAMAWGAWLVHDDPPADVSKARLAAVLKPDAAAGSVDSSLTNAEIVDSATVESASVDDSTDVVASDSTIQSVASAVVAISDSVGQPTPTSVVAADSAPVVLEAVARTEPAQPTEAAPREPVYRDPRVTRDIPAREPRVVSEKDVAAVPAPAEDRRVEASTRAAAPAAAPASTKARNPSKTPARILARAADRTPARTPARPSTKPTSRAANVSKAPATTTAKAPARVVAKAAPKPTTKTIAKAPPAKSRAPRASWVNSVAKNWVVVRAGADRGSRVIASIGPNTRVQLGESRGGWRRIRAKGLAGWVEHRSFFAGAGSYRKAGSLAAR